jgi:hypothetical protein
MFEGHVVGYVEGVLGDDARWNADELSVGSVVEEQVVAEILLSTLAKVTGATRCGVERDYTIAGRKVRDAQASLNDCAR